MTKEELFETAYLSTLLANDYSEFQLTGNSFIKEIFDHAGLPEEDVLGLVDMLGSTQTRAAQAYIECLETFGAYQEFEDYALSPEAAPKGRQGMADTAKSILQQIEEMNSSDEDSQGFDA